MVLTRGGKQVVNNLVLFEFQMRNAGPVKQEKNKQKTGRVFI